MKIAPAGPTIPRNQGMRFRAVEVGVCEIDLQMGAPARPHFIFIHALCNHAVRRSSSRTTRRRVSSSGSARRWIWSRSAALINV
jgi:hypothetical protein